MQRERSELFGIGIMFQQVAGGHILVEDIEPSCSAARSGVIQVFHDPVGSSAHSQEPGSSVLCSVFSVQ